MMVLLLPGFIWYLMFLSLFRAVSEHFQSSFRTVSEQFQGNFPAVSEQLIWGRSTDNSRAVSVQFTSLPNPVANTKITITVTALKLL